MKLTISNVSKSYGKNLALDGFSLTLEPGIYALLGPNGSGKSTLMNIITDNLKSDSGEISYTDDEGNTENILKMGVRFREKLGFMPQYPGLYPNFTVEKFMWYMASLKGLDKNTAKREIASVLEAMELDDIPRRRLGALSGGMKQRLTLASAVLGSPEILILDEPTAGLDPKQRIAIRNYISKIALHKIVMIATHVVSDVEFIAKEIVLIKKGVIVDKAPAAALTKKIEGKVWSILCSEADVGMLQSKFKVMGISRDEKTGLVLLRALSDITPNENALNVSPTLEDYYLSVFGYGVC